MLKRGYLTPSEYLFERISKRIKEEEATGRMVLKLSMGDVTMPVAPCVAEAMANASLELAKSQTFRGYPPVAGYEFCRQSIADSYGGLVIAQEVFVTDGAKSALAAWAELFDLSIPAIVPNPSYPAYWDSCMLLGRNVIDLICTEHTKYLPVPPQKLVQSIIFLCSPSNPTASIMTKDVLRQWVDYAIKSKSIILFDVAYREFVTDGVKSIYEIEGAKECAVEIGSLSKSASFGGIRCGWCVVPKEIIVDGRSLTDIWIRRQSTMFNGVSYVTQRGASAALSEHGQEHSRKCIEYYMQNVAILTKAIAPYFDINHGQSPYVWVKIKGEGWRAFDKLLSLGVAVTPGIGFGTMGREYLRLSGFAKRDDILQATSILQKNWQNL